MFPYTSCFKGIWRGLGTSTLFDKSHGTVEHK